MKMNNLDQLINYLVVTMKYPNAYKNGLAAINRIATPIQNLNQPESFPSISIPSLGCNLNLPLVKLVICSNPQVRVVGWKQKPQEL